MQKNPAYWCSAQGLTVSCDEAVSEIKAATRALFGDEMIFIQDESTATEPRVIVSYRVPLFLNPDQKALLHLLRVRVTNLELQKGFGQPLGKITSLVIH
jgi:hypothetical protein